MGLAAQSYVLPTFVLAYSALSGQFLVNPYSDHFCAGLAFRNSAAQSLRGGLGMSQWNLFLFGGMPYVATMQGDTVYPTALLRVLIPTDAGMTLGFIVHLLVGGLLTYGFLRAWRLAFISSLVSGLGYMLGGPIASFASPGHNGKLFGGALLPLTFCDACAGRARRLALGVGRTWVGSGVRGTASASAVAAIHARYCRLVRTVHSARVDFNLIGIPLTKGPCTIELRFVDPAMNVGKDMTLAALLAAVIGLAGGVMLNRRHLA